MHRLDHLKAFYKPTKQILEVVELGQNSVTLFVGGNTNDENVIYADKKDCVLIEPTEVKDTTEDERQLNEYDIIEITKISNIGGGKPQRRVIRFVDGAFRVFDVHGNQGPILNSLKASCDIKYIGNEFLHQKLLRD